MKRFLTTFLAGATWFGAAAQTTQLIIRSDDIGSSHTANRACIDVFTNGISKSVEIMAPTPWFMEAVALLNQHPNYDVGVHLVLTSEWEKIKWRPLTHAPTLVDANGYFPPFVWENKKLPQADYLLKRPLNLAEVEAEFRAQIELVKKHLPHVSHLSAHMGCTVATKEITELTQRLAQEYKLPINLPVKTTPFVGFSGAEKSPEQKEKDLVAALEKLPAGTHYLVEHPGYDEGDMRGMGHIGYEQVARDREGVTRAFTSKAVQEVITRRNIKLVSIKELLTQK